MMLSGLTSHFYLSIWQEVPLEHHITDGKLEVGDKVELKGEPLENAVRYLMQSQTNVLLH